MLKWCRELNREITNEMWNGIFDNTESSAMPQKLRNWRDCLLGTELQEETCRPEEV